MLAQAARVLAILGLAVIACVRLAFAQTPSPAPSASPAPSPSPTPVPHGVRFSTIFETTFIGQTTSGPGQVAPEAPGFIAGSPVAPNTPYDLLTAAPLTPGVAWIAQDTTTATYRTPALRFGLTAGLGLLSGSLANGVYWGESLIPALNPHMGSQALPYAIAFPTAQGQDNATAIRLSVLGGSIATRDGNLTVKGGYFDLTQTDRFVFAQPALANVSPAIAYAPAESLSSGLAGSDIWQPLASQMQLAGVDVVGKRDLATLEISNAALPSPAGTSARMTLGSLVFDHGEGTRYSAEFLHANTSGAPFSAGVAFGADPQFFATPQGTLISSTLSGQQQTIAGVRAAFHLMPGWSLDSVVELGRAWYDAQNVAMPGTSAPGGFYHLGFTKTQGRATATLDVIRIDARYATLLLPYGVAENKWSVPFAWPGQWPSAGYQLFDDSVIGVNRYGYRLRYFVDRGPFECHLEYTDLRQAAPETTQTSQYTGYADGFFLPQLPQNATFGRQRRYGVWTAWHPGFGDLTIDVVDDQLYRPYVVRSDQVAYDVPQIVVTYGHHFSPAVVGAAGVGRYAQQGTFAQPIDFAQNLYFAGIVVKESARASLLATFRRALSAGVTPVPPNFASSLFFVEQRYQ